MWAEVVVGSCPCPNGFLRFSDFPSATKNDISKFKFDLETVDEKPLCCCAIEITIYLFYVVLFGSTKKGRTLNTDWSRDCMGERL